MPKLHMETDHVENVAYQMKREADRIHELTQRLYRSVNRLDQRWSGGRSRRFAREMSHALRRADRLGNDMHRLGQRAHAEAEEWLEVDRHGAIGFQSINFAAAEGAERTGVTGPSGLFGSRWMSNPGEAQRRSDTWFDQLKRMGVTAQKVALWGGLGAAASVAFSMREGSAYAGEVILRGGHLTRSYAQLSPHLTNIRAGQLAGHITKHSHHLGRAAVGMAVLSAVPQWIHDAKEYKHDGAKMGAAMATDGAVIIGSKLLAAKVGIGGGAILGAKIGAVVGSVVPGAGTALGMGAGAVIGGAVGAIGASWVSDKVSGAYLKSGFRDKVIGGGAAIIKKGAGVAKKVVETAGKAILKSLWPF